MSMIVGLPRRVRFIQQTSPTIERHPSPVPASGRCAEADPVSISNLPGACKPLQTVLNLELQTFAELASISHLVPFFSAERLRSSRRPFVDVLRRNLIGCSRSRGPLQRCHCTTSGLM